MRFVSRLQGKTFVSHKRLVGQQDPDAEARKMLQGRDDEEGDDDQEGE